DVGARVALDLVRGRCLIARVGWPLPNSTLRPDPGGVRPGGGQWLVGVSSAGGLGGLMCSWAGPAPGSWRGGGRHVQVAPPLHWPDSHHTHLARTRPLIDSSVIGIAPRVVGGDRSGPKRSSEPALLFRV